MEESIFIKRLQTRDRDAFNELTIRFKDKVLNTALGLVHDQEDAEDITQEVFIEIFQSISEFKGLSKLSTWVYRITVQKSLEHIRRKSRKKRSGIILSLFGKEQVLPVASDSPFYHPGVKMENKERSAVLFKAIAQLPINQQTSFTLSKLENLSYAEIAEVMEVTESAVESLLFRAKQNLRKILADYYDNNEK